MANFDKALELRNVADGAETASANRPGVALDVSRIGDFECVVNVTAIDAANGDETYVVTISVDTTAAMPSPVAVAARTISRSVSVPYQVRIPLNSAECALLEPGAAAIRVGCTLGGTTPSLTYGAYVAPTTKNAGAIADRA